MKIFFIGVLLIGLSTNVLWAECNPQNSIALKSSKSGSKRDWAKDFDKLEKKYANEIEGVTQLRHFFYDSNGVKECITLTDLQTLSKEVQIVFKDVSGPAAISFRDVITNVAKRNLPLKHDESGFEKVNQTEQEANSMFLRKNEPEATQPNGDDNTNNINTPTDKKSEEFSNKTEQTGFEWPWISVALGVLSLALGGLALLLNSRIQQQRSYYIAYLKDHERNVRDDLERQFDNVSREKFDRLTAKNKELEQTNAELLIEIEKLERGTSMEAASTSSINPAESSNPSPTYIQSTTDLFIAKAFYLSTPTPTSDGLCTFLDHRKAQFDPTSSLYRFELINNNENQAQFRFESTSGTVSGALSYPDTYLQPACEYTGLDSKATQIDTIQPGKATRQGNVWRVTEKAQIKFV